MNIKRYIYIYFYIEAKINPKFVAKYESNWVKVKIAFITNPTGKLNNLPLVFG